MERPALLRACTVGETRKEIKSNIEALKNIGWILANGFIEPELLEHESPINKIMTEYVIQAEYLRDREANNWGWDRNVVDFSKTAN